LRIRFSLKRYTIVTSYQRNALLPRYHCVLKLTAIIEHILAATISQSQNIINRVNAIVFFKAMFYLSAFSTCKVWAVCWLDLDESEDYTARHKTSFVQAGGRFYLFGGRENPQTVDTYDFVQDNWTRSASTPVPFNHFQAAEYQGLIWVIGVFKNNRFPNEEPAEYIYTYDPAYDALTQCREIPEARRHGSASLVNYQGKFYVVGGNTIGHNGGYVSWFDKSVPETGEWAAPPMS